MGSSTVPAVIQEDGVLAWEGEGTWADWVTTDPNRVKDLFAVSVMKLQHRYSDLPNDPTDSDYGTETANLRHVAHEKKVTCGCLGWHGYDRYRLDFEAGDSTSDPVFRELHAHVKHTVITEKKIHSPHLCGPPHRLSRR